MALWNYLKSAARAPKPGKNLRLVLEKQLYIRGIEYLPITCIFTRCCVLSLKIEEKKGKNPVKIDILLFVFYEKGPRVMTEERLEMFDFEL